MKKVLIRKHFEVVIEIEVPDDTTDFYDYADQDDQEPDWCSTEVYNEDETEVLQDW